MCPGNRASSTPHSQGWWNKLLGQVGSACAWRRARALLVGEFRLILVASVGSQAPSMHCQALCGTDSLMLGLYCGRGAERTGGNLSLTRPLPHITAWGGGRGSVA